MYSELFRLDEKVALVTGGSSGIGKAISECFAEMGATVVIVSRNTENLQAAASDIQQKFGGTVVPIAANIGNLDDIEGLVREFNRLFDRIHILVNTAGANPYFGPFENIEVRTWNKMIDVNLKGTFYLSAAFADIMQRCGGGSIINISSIRAFRAVEGGGMYALCKSGICRMTEILSIEWAKRGIRVNAIAPGVIKTKFSQIMWDDKEMLEKNLKQIPMGRIAEPHEVAGAALYYASDASSYTTGTTLLVDGGMYHS